MSALEELQISTAQVKKNLTKLLILHSTNQAFIEERQHENHKEIPLVVCPGEEWWQYRGVGVLFFWSDRKGLVRTDVKIDGAKYRTIVEVNLLDEVKTFN
ncbi:hypothetical protein ILYODFUR_008849 [Ilyodon furcidens]|uniref:Uncharacterized protein n=1 Tax=Ilyodon furcidens TaxID=33524 RepID=A0ABV0VCB6_9TELE